MKKLVTALSLALFIPLLSVAQDTTLRVVGTFSSTNLYPQFEQPFWTETLPEASNGTLVADLVPVDQSGIGASDVFENVSLGLFDVGATVIDYVVGQDSRLEGVDMPAVAPDAATAQAVAEAYRPLLEEAFEETFDSKLLAVIPFTSQVVFCREPIAGLADLAGKKIRGSGRSTLEFIEAVGATSVNIAFGEVPTSLERGVVDCAITGALSGYNSGWPEVTSHFYPLQAGGWDPVGIAINNSVWDGLSEETQTLLSEQLADLEAKVWAAADEDTAVGVACNTGGECPYGEAASMTLVPVSDADLELSRTLVRDEVLPAWAERCGEACITRWNETVGQVLGISLN